MHDDDHDDDGDDGDPLWMPFTGGQQDAAVNGAAADSADDTDERLKGLPRILRYAMLAHDNADLIEQRLIAEIVELCPDLPHIATWAIALDGDAGLALAAELDRLAVVRDLPLLRSIGDCVRLVSLSVPCDANRFEQFRRVARALILAFTEHAVSLDDARLCDLERFICGWAALPAAADVSASRRWPAINSAAHLGDQLMKCRIRAATIEIADRMRRQMEVQTQSARELAGLTSASARDSLPNAPPQPTIIPPVPPHHVVVGRMDEAEIKSQKLKSLIEPVKGVVNTPVALVETPALKQVRSALMAEFPYAIDVIDAILTDLIGRPTVRLRPLLLVGEPGGGKSRFARRLGELLGVTVWRVDAAQSDGAVFGGTDRRWHSAECCHPLLAIVRGKSANPLILLDELEKAGTRSDSGRLWDCLLGLLEPETSSRYPDPALQIPLDLSHISYVATANSLDPLPVPLQDRFRIVSFPKPTFDDLDALLPGLIASLATTRGIDARWIAPLDIVERATIAQAWSGGSIRRLQRVLEAILLTRDRATSWH